MILLGKFKNQTKRPQVLAANVQDRQTEKSSNHTHTHTHTYTRISSSSYYPSIRCLNKTALPRFGCSPHRETMSSGRLEFVVQSRFPAKATEFPETKAHTSSRHQPDPLLIHTVLLGSSNLQTSEQLLNSPKKIIRL